MADNRPGQEPQIHVNTDEARGASTPGVGRYVLAASMLLIIVLFAALLLF